MDNSLGLHTQLSFSTDNSFFIHSRVQYARVFYEVFKAETIKQMVIETTKRQTIYQKKWIFFSTNTSTPYYHFDSFHLATVQNPNHYSSDRCRSIHFDMENETNGTDLNWSEEYLIHSKNTKNLSYIHCLPFNSTTMASINAVRAEDCGSIQQLHS